MGRKSCGEGAGHVRGASGEGGHRKAKPVLPVLWLFALFAEESYRERVAMVGE